MDMENKRVLVLTGTTDILRSSSETDNTMEEVFDLNLCFGFHGRGISELRSQEDNQQLLDKIKLLDSVQL
jgi:hypothetical protein